MSLEKEIEKTARGALARPRWGSTTCS